MQHLDVSSFLGPASMVERWIGSTTRRCGVYGGEFLQQGFAYKQSGGREEGSRATRVWRKVCGARVYRHDLLSIINSGVWAPILTPTHSSMIISDEPRCQDSINPIYIYSLRLAIFYLPEIRSSVPSYLVQSRSQQVLYSFRNLISLCD